VPDKPDPKRVAECLAGGSTVRKALLKVSSGGAWVSQSITCPYCNTNNPAALKKLHGVVTCSNCHKEIRILDEEEREVDVGDATKQIYDELVRSGSFGFSTKGSSVDELKEETEDKEEPSPDNAE